MKTDWESSPDTALREKLWAGSVPIKIELALNDVSALESPKPMYVLANRLTYLATLLKDIKKHFDSAAPSPCDQSDIWMDYAKTPLSWYVPVGVLFDMLVVDQQQIPWSLTLHYRGIQDDQLLRCSGLDSIRFHYINALKEALYLRTNSSKEIMNMQKEEETKLIESIMQMDFLVFWSINSKLIDLPKGDLHKTSIRVFFNKLETYIQLPVNLVDKEGKDITVGEFLRENICPELLEDHSSEGQKIIIKNPAKASRILIHGIECALETPLYWLHLNMAYIDNFVYIVIVTT